MGAILSASQASTNSPAPPANSLLSWSSDPSTIPTGAGQIAIGGTLYLSMFSVNQSITLNNIWFITTVAAITPTVGESQVGIYNAAGTLVASATAAATATAMTASPNPMQVALSAPYAAAPGSYWVGMVFQAATEPTLVRSSVNTVIYSNSGITAAAKYRFCVNGTAITTALPPSITTSSNTLTNAFPYWVGVS